MTSSLCHQYLCMSFKYRLVDEATGLNETRRAPPTDLAVIDETLVQAAALVTLYVGRSCPTCQPSLYFRTGCRSLLDVSLCTRSSSFEIHSLYTRAASFPIKCPHAPPWSSRGNLLLRLLDSVDTVTSFRPHKTIGRCCKAYSLHQWID